MRSPRVGVRGLYGGAEMHRLKRADHTAVQIATPPHFTEAPMKIHPACAAFPELPQAEKDALDESIKKNGLIHPIILCGEDGSILDGRHRYDSCKRIGKPAKYTRLPKSVDPWEYAIAANLHRRHLTTSQRAAVAADIENQLSKIVGVTLPRITASEASERMKVSESIVDRQRVVKRTSPELHEQVRAGNLTTNAAYQQVKAKSEPAEDKKATDVHGDPLPPKLQKIFDDGDVMKEWANNLRDIARDIERAVRGREAFTAYLFNWQQAVAGIKDAAQTIVTAKLYCKCPCCGGDGCDYCHGRFDPKELPGSIGIVSEFFYKQVPTTLRRGTKK